MCNSQQYIKIASNLCRLLDIFANNKNEIKHIRKEDGTTLSAQIIGLVIVKYAINRYAQRLISIFQDLKTMFSFSFISSDF